MSILDGPGEGTWSVFAQKVVAQRDEWKERTEKAETRLKEIISVFNDGKNGSIEDATKNYHHMCDRINHANIVLEDAGKQLFGCHARIKELEANIDTWEADILKAANETELRNVLSTVLSEMGKITKRTVCDQITGRHHFPAGTDNPCVCRFYR